MKHRRLPIPTTIALILALSPTSPLAPLSFLSAPARAAETTAALSEKSRNEIRHLLDHLGASSCQFNRNGRWYNATEARQHLTQKFDYLLKKGLLTSSEDFIQLAAANSSVSGKPYRLKCGATGGDTEMDSAPWLTQELARYRQFAGRRN